MAYQIWKEKDVTELEDIVVETIQNECSGKREKKRTEARRPGELQVV